MLVEWKRNLVVHSDAREEKWRGKRRMEWVAKQSSVWLGTVHPVLLQSFSPDPHSKKAHTRLNWHPRRYKWTRPFRWKTESGFCACAVTFRFHSTCSAYSHSFRNSSILPFSAATFQAVLFLISLAKKVLLFNSSCDITSLAHSKSLCDISSLPFSDATCQTVLPQVSLAKNNFLFNAAGDSNP